MASLTSATITGITRNAITLNWTIAWDACDSDSDHALRVRVMGDDSAFLERIFDPGDDLLSFRGYVVGPPRTSYSTRFFINTNEDWIGRDELYAEMELLSVARATASPERRTMRTPVVFIG